MMVIALLLYNCASWTHLKIHCNKLRTAHHLIMMLLRILGAWCRSQVINPHYLKQRRPPTGQTREHRKHRAHEEFTAGGGAVTRMGNHSLLRRITSRELQIAGQPVRRGTRRKNGRTNVWDQGWLENRRIRIWNVVWRRLRGKGQAGLLMTHDDMRRVPPKPVKKPVKRKRREKWKRRTRLWLHRGDSHINWEVSGQNWLGRLEVSPSGDGYAGWDAWESIRVDNKQQTENTATARSISIIVDGLPRSNATWLLSWGSRCPNIQVWALGRQCTLFRLRQRLNPSCCVSPTSSNDKASVLCSIFVLMLPSTFCRSTSIPGREAERCRQTSCIMGGR